nr:hypothetical protein BHI3_03330 [Bacteriovorax sp. HI3]
MGTWFHVPALKLSTTAFDKTFLYLTISHTVVLIVMKLLTRDDDPFLNDHFAQNIDYKKLNIVMVFNTLLLVFYYCLPHLQLPGNYLYIVNIIRKFLMNILCIDIIVVFVLFSSWSILKRKTIALAILMLGCQVVFSTLMGARHGFILFGFLILLNMLVGSINYKFKKTHLVWGTVVLVLFLIQYDLGTRNRVNRPTESNHPLSYHLYRFSSRLSGIDYVHLFLNSDSPEKRGAIQEELLLSKRVKAGLNRFVGARVYNEHTLALLFRYFYLPDFKTISSSLKSYNSDMPTWFGESYLYFKNSTIAFGLIGLLATFSIVIYNAINSRVLAITFLWLFHEFFTSFGFFDWFLPDALSMVVSMTILLWFLSKNKNYKTAN